MKVIFLTQYFPPEVGAPQNRLYETASLLHQKGVKVTVLTAMSNYPQMKIYEDYRGRLYFHEKQNGIDVHRSWIYASAKRSVVKRLLNYFSFVFSSLFIGIFKLKKADYLFCESPPLFLGITAFLLSRFKRARLIFNVSDLWPESAEKLGVIRNKFLLGLSYWLEKFLYRKSYLITGQTQGIVENIAARSPNKIVYWLKNGVDVSAFSGKEIAGGWREKNGFADDDFIVIYAGIIGHAQGLDVILSAAERLQTHRRIKFVLLGDGPEKRRLVQEKLEKQLENVFFFDAVKKEKMPGIISCCDAAVIPLKKLDLFKGAIPSKIFENLVMRKPVLLGVDGEARELIIEQGKAGLFFEPEDPISLSDNILKLYNEPELVKEFGENGYNFVNNEFNRKKITEEFYQFLHFHLKSKA